MELVCLEVIFYSLLIKFLSKHICIRYFPMIYVFNSVCLPLYMYMAICINVVRLIQKNFDTKNQMAEEKCQEEPNETTV